MKFYNDFNSMYKVQSEVKNDMSIFNKVQYNDGYWNCKEVSNRSWAWISPSEDYISVNTGSMESIFPYLPSEALDKLSSDAFWLGEIKQILDKNKGDMDRLCELNNIKYVDVSGHRESRHAALGGGSWLEVDLRKPKPKYLAQGAYLKEGLSTIPGLSKKIAQGLDDVMNDILSQYDVSQQEISTKLKEAAETEKRKSEATDRRLLLYHP